MREERRTARHDGGVVRGKVAKVVLEHEEVVPLDQPARRIASDQIDVVADFLGA